MTEDRLNKAISDIAYILDSLILLRQIHQTGDCNICKNKDCGYKPKTRHWIIDVHRIRAFGSKNETHEYSVHCDKCNYVWDYTTNKKKSLVSNFCPNCGVRMIESQERSERMTCKENITAILECYFTGFKKEIIDSACNRILEEGPNIEHYWIGYWIPKNKNKWKCSACGRMVYSKTESNLSNFHVFCSKCGCRMVVGSRKSEK